MPIKKKENKPPAVGGEETLGQRLKRFRGKMSQEKLSEETGIPRISISDYERGRLRMPAEVAILIAQTLEISTDELLGAENPTKPSVALYQRFKKIEKLPITHQQKILETLDTFIRGLEK